MNTVLTAAGAALVCAAAAMVLKENGAKTLGYLTAVAGGIVILVFLTVKFLPETESVKAILEYAGNDEYQAVMYRALGVGLVTEASAGICREMGEAGIAGKVEFAGKLVLVIMCLPLIGEVLNISRGML